MPWQQAPDPYSLTAPCDRCGSGQSQGDRSFAHVYDLTVRVALRGDTKQALELVTATKRRADMAESAERVVAPRLELHVTSAAVADASIGC